MEPKQEYHDPSKEYFAAGVLGSVRASWPFLLMGAVFISISVSALVGAIGRFINGSVPHDWAQLIGQ